MAQYTVQNGDMLGTIAQNLGVNQDQITGYKSGNPNIIYPGEVLNVGGGISAPTSTTQAPPLTTTQQLVNQITSHMGQMPTPQNFVSPQDYAAPQQAVLNQIYQQQALPLFQQQTLNPFNEQYANGAAASGTNLMGNGQQNYKTALYGVQTPFQNQWQAATDAYNKMITQGYNNQLSQYLNQPVGLNTTNS